MRESMGNWQQAVQFVTILAQRVLPVWQPYEASVTFVHECALRRQRKQIGKRAIGGRQLTTPPQATAEECGKILKFLGQGEIGERKNACQKNHLGGMSMKGILVQF